MAEKRGVQAFTVGLLLSVCLAFLTVLIFSTIVSLTAVDAAVIKLVNQIIKVLCIFVGVTFFLKSRGGLISGALFGVCFVVATNLIFSALSGKFDFSVSILWELLFGLAVGGISGTVAAAVRK